MTYELRMLLIHTPMNTMIVFTLSCARVHLNLTSDHIHARTQRTTRQLLCNVVVGCVLKVQALCNTSGLRYFRVVRASWASVSECVRGFPDTIPDEVAKHGIRFTKLLTSTHDVGFGDEVRRDRAYRLAADDRSEELYSPTALYNAMKIRFAQMHTPSGTMLGEVSLSELQSMKQKCVYLKTC